MPILESKLHHAGILPCGDMIGTTTDRVPVPSGGWQRGRGGGEEEGGKLFSEHLLHAKPVVCTST